MNYVIPGFFIHREMLEIHLFGQVRVKKLLLLNEKSLWGERSDIFEQG